jgi:hypothetical protein
VLNENPPVCADGVPNEKPDCVEGVLNEKPAEPPPDGNISVHM